MEKNNKGALKTAGFIPAFFLFKKNKNIYELYNNNYNFEMETKKNCYMCPTKKLSDECLICIEDIQKESSLIMQELKKEFQETQKSMRDEWTVFINECSISNEKEKLQLEDHVDKRDKSSLGLVKFVMGICLVLVISCVGAVSYNAGMISDLQNEKADRAEVLLLNEAESIQKLGDAYYDSKYVWKEQQKIDSANYNWLMKSIFKGTLRGNK